MSNSASPGKRRRFKSNLPLLLRRPTLYLRFYKWPLLILLIGSVLDGLTTYEVLSEYGAGVEVHPVGRLFAQILGVTPVTMAISKLVQSAFAIFVASLWRRWCSLLLTLAGLLYVLAAVSNHFRLL